MSLSSRNRSNSKAFRHILPCVAPFCEGMHYHKTGVPWQMNNTFILLILSPYIFSKPCKYWLSSLYTHFSHPAFFLINSCIFSCFFGHFGYNWVIFLIRKALRNKAFMSYLCMFLGYKPVFIQFLLCFFQPGKFFLCIVIAGMRVNIQRHRYV